MSKPRSDSILKTLPAERQAAIAEYMAAKSLIETRDWLKADGIKTSVTSLSEFGSWYYLRRQLTRNESTVEELLKNLSATNPDWSPGQIQEAGQAFFTALALQQQDSEAWVRTQGLALKRQELALARDKFEFDAAKACLARLPELQAVSTRPKLNDEEKAIAIQQILFPK